jgi:hypothetical protein
MRLSPPHLTKREWQQLPLPKRYQCLTWQLNVSFYPPGKLVKFVSTLRDPIDNVEIHRRGADKQSYPDYLEVLMKHTENQHNLVEYLTGIDEPF